MPHFACPRAKRRPHPSRSQIQALMEAQMKEIRNEISANARTSQATGAARLGTGGGAHHGIQVSCLSQLLNSCALSLSLSLQLLPMLSRSLCLPPSTHFWPPLRPRECRWVESRSSATTTMGRHMLATRIVGRSASPLLRHRPWGARRRMRRQCRRHNRKRNAKKI